MATTTITQTTELAHRTRDGIHIYLFWNQLNSRITVRVFDERTNNGFELEVDSRDALDAFNHPFAYAARRNMFIPIELAGLEPATSRVRELRPES